MREYTIIYESGKRKWSAYVPDLPGCIATGKTRPQVEERIREAIEFHIEVCSSGEIPCPHRASKLARSAFRSIVSTWSDEVSWPTKLPAAAARATCSYNSNERPPIRVE